MAERRIIFGGRGPNPVGLALQGLGASIGGALANQSQRRTQQLQQTTLVGEQERALQALNLQGQQNLATAELAAAEQGAQERQVQTDLDIRQQRTDLLGQQVGIQAGQLQLNQRELDSLIPVREAEARVKNTAANQQEFQTKMQQELTGIDLPISLYLRVAQHQNPSAPGTILMSGMAQSLHNAGVVDEHGMINAAVAERIGLKMQGLAQQPVTRQKLLELSTDVVEALARSQNSNLTPDDIPPLTASIFDSLQRLATDPGGTTQEIRATAARIAAVEDQLTQRLGANPTPEALAAIPQTARALVNQPRQAPGIPQMPETTGQPPPQRQPALESLNQPAPFAFSVQGLEDMAGIVARGLGNTRGFVQQLQDVGFTPFVAGEAVRRARESGDPQDMMRVLETARPQAMQSTREREALTRRTRLHQRRIQQMRSLIAQRQMTISQAVEQLTRLPNGFTADEARQLLGQ